METVAEKYDGNDPIRPEGYLYRAARKAGRIGGHLSLVLTDSVKLASDCVTYVQDAYRRAKTSIGRDTRDKGGNHGRKAREKPGVHRRCGQKGVLLKPGKGYRRIYAIR